MIIVDLTIKTCHLILINMNANEYYEFWDSRISDDVELSVICITYNQSSYISKALDSILSQRTDFPFEIVICNNASTDETKNIIASYYGTFNNIKVINIKSKINATECSSLVLPYCKGKFLASCEGDDYWIDDTKLQTQVNFLKSNPLYVGCVHNVLLINAEGNKLKKQHLNWLSRKKIFSINDFDGYHLPGHINSFVRRNLLLDHSFDISLVSSASNNIGDRTIFLLWLSKGPIIKLNHTFSAYRVIRNQKNLTSSLYTNNKTKTAMEFEYVNKLRHFITDELQTKSKITYRYYILFTEALLNKLLYKGDKELPKLILHSIKNKFLCILLIPWIIIYKIYIKIFTTQ